MDWIYDFVHEVVFHEVYNERPEDYEWVTDRDFAEIVNEVKNLDTVQDLILAYDYQHALETLDKIAPYDFRDIDWEVFQNTAERAYYEYYE